MTYETVLKMRDLLCVEPCLSEKAKTYNQGVRDAMQVFVEACATETNKEKLLHLVSGEA